MKNQLGIGIIELMVSITIAAFVLAGVFQLYLTSTQNVSAFEGSSRIQENARYVFARLERDIGQAGNMGCFSFTALNQAQVIDVEQEVEGVTQTVQVKSTLNRRIDNRLTTGTGPGGPFDFTRFIDGQNNTEPGVSGATSTDRIFLRFASAEYKYPLLAKASGSFTLPGAAMSAFSSSGIAMVGDCSTVSMFQVTGVDTNNNRITFSGNFNQYVAENANSETVTKGISRTYVYGGDSGVVEYYVGTSAAGTAAGSTCTDNPQYCALFRKSNNNATPLELVEGVQDLQFEYGRINDAGNLIMLDATGIDSAATSGVAEADYAWSKIDRVKVTAVFNSISNATTNEGLDLLTRTYSRVFVIHNQIPFCADCKGAI